MPYVYSPGSDNENEEEESSWADMAAAAEDKKEEKFGKARIKEVNVQEVVVASAGDDGAVWLWKPLQAHR